jgi:hypothetical protein
MLWMSLGKIVLLKCIGTASEWIGNGNNSTSFLHLHFTYKKFWFSLPPKNGGKLVGERGFEPPAPASRRQCSTRLSYSPTNRSTPAPEGSGGEAGVRH